MRWLVLCIVGGVYEQNSIVKNVYEDDRTAKLSVIALNGLCERHSLISCGVLLPNSTFILII